MSPAFFGLNFEQCTRSYVLGKTLKATKCTCSSSSKELELPRQVHTYLHTTQEGGILLSRCQFESDFYNPREEKNATGRGDILRMSLDWPKDSRYQSRDFRHAAVVLSVLSFVQQPPCMVETNKIPSEIFTTTIPHN